MNKQIPEGWKKRKLGEVAQLIMGQSPTSDTYNNNQLGVPFFQGKADFGSTHPTVKYWCTSPTKIAPKGSILLSVRAPVGAVNLNNVEACIGRGLASISGHEIRTDFLYQLLIFEKEKFEALAQGSTFEAINGNELKEFPIINPPPSEQKKIASILKSIDAVIVNTQNQINKLKDLKTATINNLLSNGIGPTEFKRSELGDIPTSWEVYKVSDLLAQSKIKGKSNLPIYSVLVDGGMVNRNSQERRIPSELEDTSNLYVEKGNLAYNMMRMWQGASGIAPVDCLVSPAYVVCVPTNLIISKFLGYLLKSEESIQKLCAYSQGITSDRLRLYFEHFSQIKFAIPPIQEQEKIAEIISGVEENLYRKTQKLAQLATLKKSLMQDLFTGKIRVEKL